MAGRCVARFFFAAGSDPQRAHGLSKLGWMREVVLGPPSTPSESAYFGILTASPEESLDRARKSVDTTQSSSSIFNAVSGRNTAGRSRSAITRFEFAAAANWSDRGLIDHAKSTFHEKSIGARLPGQNCQTSLRPRFFSSWRLS